MFYNKGLIGRSYVTETSAGKKDAEDDRVAADYLLVCACRVVRARGEACAGEPVRRACAKAVHEIPGANPRGIQATILHALLSVSASSDHVPGPDPPRHDHHLLSFLQKVQSDAAASPEVIGIGFLRKTISFQFKSVIEANGNHDELGFHWLFRIKLRA
jgi:hypothetical protein